MITPQHEPSSPVPTVSRNRRRGAFALSAGVGLVATVMAVGAGTANAAPGEISPGASQANVVVSSAIALTGLTPSFTLTGLPGATVLGTGAVTMNVQTNNLAGYSVTVESATSTLVATAAGNTDAIPIGALSVREGGTTAFTPLSATTPTAVHTQATRSAEAGDTITNDYQVVIPFVNEDTYTTTLDYVATTL